MHTEERAVSALLFGNYDLLLITRYRLLASIGCESVSASTLCDFRAKLLLHHIRIVVLCQSATREERALVSAFTAQHAPHARILMLSNLYWSPAISTHGQVLEAATAPASFLQTVKQILSTTAAHLPC